MDEHEEEMREGVWEDGVGLTTRSPRRSVVSEPLRIRLDMKRTIHLMEQLEEASIQLNKGTAVGARLALLLVDNVVELLMYRSAKSIISLYALLDGLPIPQKYPPKKRRDILDHFDPKVSFLARDEHRITEDEAEVIRSGHRLRNEAYHVGILRQTFLLPMTQTYFTMACALLPRIGCDELEYHGPGDYSEEQAFLRRHGIPEPWRLGGDSLSRICTELAANHTCPVDQLAGALSRDLMDRLSRLENDLDFLLHSLTGPTTDDVLKLVQFYNTELKQLGDPSTVSPSDKARVDRLWSTFQPPVTTKNLATWKHRAQGVAHAQSSGAALRMFWSIDHPLTRLSQEIRDAVEQIDREIQREVDLRLGK